MESHQKLVKNIQAQIRYFYAHKQKVRIYHGASNSTRKPDFDPSRIIDTSGLSRVLEINTDEQYALVEPSVTMDQLVDTTVPYGLLPPVVTEFPGISVGGAVQGGAAESSSFRWGGFHETALEYEIILGDGERLIVSRTKHPDLFWGAACTYGSLGVITMVKLTLVPVSKYVKLSYYRTDSLKAMLSQLDSCTLQSVNFVDGILFEPRLGVVMSGEFADTPSGPTVRFLGKKDPWFYLHARRLIKTNDFYTEYIPIKDYLFRYDRGAFWMGRQAFRLFRIPFNRFTRRVLDSQMHTRQMYEWLHATNMSQRYIVQDCCMPSETVERLLRYIDQELHIYPLWLLPLKPSGELLDKFGLSFTGSEPITNVGIWGRTSPPTFDEFVTINRALETEVFQLGGRKTLYAHAYYPESEFWKLYDKSHYDKLRKKYRADAIFDNLYDKVTVRQAYHAPLHKALWQIFKKDVRKKLGFKPSSTN